MTPGAASPEEAMVLAQTPEARAAYADVVEAETFGNPDLLLIEGISTTVSAQRRIEEERRKATDTLSGGTSDGIDSSTADLLARRYLGAIGLIPTRATASNN